ncbi:hypothetical protein [Haloglomus litoreum]|uniref:hypothetical protein n=1 Tax=Haloglomus litoreum TaxID=3034026 RepID=UPI0023E79F82|nr:hypothetical protein [Haloglomus sp. DT116]
MADPVAVGGGAVMLVLGLISAVFPRSTAWLGERIDAIGSRRPGEVEPTWARVVWERMAGVFIAFLGLVFIAAGL